MGDNQSFGTQFFQFIYCVFIPILSSGRFGSHNPVYIQIIECCLRQAQHANRLGFIIYLEFDSQCLDRSLVEYLYRCNFTCSFKRRFERCKPLISNLTHLPFLIDRNYINQIFRFRLDIKSIVFRQRSGISRRNSCSQTCQRQVYLLLGHFIETLCIRFVGSRYKVRSRITHNYPTAFIIRRDYCPETFHRQLILRNIDCNRYIPLKFGFRNRNILRKDRSRSVGIDCINSNRIFRTGSKTYPYTLLNLRILKGRPYQCPFCEGRVYIRPVIRLHRIALVRIQ